MEPIFLDYYNRELRYLRELGGQFARDFPEIAGRLGLDSFECADPYVERLLEGFAFLAARVQLKIDGEFPRFTESLLSLVCPHYLAPTPSMTIVRLEPDENQGGLVDGFTVPRGTALRCKLQRDDPTVCEFRTGHDVTLWPVELAGLKLAPVTGTPDVAFDAGTRMRSAITLRLRTTTGIQFSATWTGQSDAFLSWHGPRCPAPFRALRELRHWPRGADTGAGLDAPP